MSAVAGPAASAEFKNPGELASIVRKSASRIRMHCNDGSLHAHRDQDIPKARWSVPLVCALAWKAGYDETYQRGICPLCAVLADIPAPRVTSISRAKGGRR